jgi:molybdate transport system ATP-binding protein
MAAPEEEGYKVNLLLKNISLPLPHFSLEVNLELRGRITVMFGPSGSGKTSLLDLIAGLRRPTSARIELDGEVLTDTAGGVRLPPHRRRIGYVPQDLALFPHLSVTQNLLYGKRSDASPNFSFEKVVALLELQPLLQRRVTDLSGGERQRVALGRALVSAPRLLLLDEPLASLDARLKAKVLPYLTRIRDECAVPMLYVTHDRFEALTLADEMVVMAAGKVVQAGAVQEVFSRPADLSVAGILTVESVLPGRVLKVAEDLVTVAVGTTQITAMEHDLPSSTKDVSVCIRAEDVILLRGEAGPSSPRNHLPGTVRALSREGPLMRVELDCGFPLVALLTKQACEELALAPGQGVIALVKAPSIHLIAR